MPTEFRDDEGGYQRWMEEHPEGFVLNTRRRPAPTYMVLHRAGCVHITRHRNPQAFTGMGYMKVCDDEQAELLAWVKDQGAPGFTKHCALCNP